MKKVLVISVIFGVLGVAIFAFEKGEGIEKDSETIYTYVNEVSADSQFNSDIGLATEQPVFDENSQKIGKRLFVDSSKELLTRESIKAFYDYVLSLGIDYEEIVISIDDDEAIQISLKENEVWYCSINEGMELTKIKKINN